MVLWRGTWLPALSLYTETTTISMAAAPVPPMWIQFSCLAHVTYQSKPTTVIPITDVNIQTEFNRELSVTEIKNTTIPHFGVLQEES